METSSQEFQLEFTIQYSAKKRSIITSCFGFCNTPEHGFDLVRSLTSFSCCSACSLWAGTRVALSTSTSLLMSILEAVKRDTEAVFVHKTSNTCTRSWVAPNSCLLRVREEMERPPRAAPTMRGSRHEGIRPATGSGHQRTGFRCWTPTILFVRRHIGRQKVFFPPTRTFNHQQKFLVLQECNLWFLQFPLQVQSALWL